jgi:hypothetical protein
MAFWFIVGFLAGLVLTVGALMFVAWQVGARIDRRQPEERTGR